MSSVRDLFKIPIQIRCSLPQTCSILSVLNFEVNYPQELSGKITMTSLSYLSYCTKGILRFVRKVKTLRFLDVVAF